MSSNQPPVQVTVNVNVSVNGVPVEAAAAFSPRRAFKALAGGSFNVSIPAPQGSPPLRVARVRIDPLAGGQQTICATGTLGIAAPCVFARVYPGVVTASASPPSCDPLLRAAPTDDTQNWAWVFSRMTGNELPGASCAASGTLPSNTLALWAIFDGDMQYTSQSITFFGQCSDRTDCDGMSGPTSTLAGFPVLERAGPRTPAVLVGTVRDKRGAFTSLPDAIAFVWDPHRQRWQGAQVGGAFALAHAGGEFHLTGPAGTQAHRIAGCCGHEPLHLAFAVTHADGGFRLDVTE